MSSASVDEAKDHTTGWDSAIRLAESELEKVAQRSRQLRRAIRLLKRNRDDGLEWPIQGK